MSTLTSTDAVPSLTETIARLDGLSDQMRACVLLAMASDYPAEFAAAAGTFERHFAAHPEQVRP